MRQEFAQLPPLLGFFQISVSPINTGFSTYPIPDHPKRRWSGMGYVGGYGWSGGLERSFNKGGT
ncbi:MAG: hypothetical protein OXB86_02950 [Bdellovibrionales bacterium]|nr:hypothetical protein [Bdellovibrionales bacterium]